MKQIILGCALAALTACNSATTKLANIQPSRGIPDGKLFVCAPNIYFGILSNSPSLFVNDVKIAKPTKGANVSTAVSIGDTWEITLKKNFLLLGPAQFEDLNVTKGIINSKGETYVVLTAHLDWGGALGSLGTGSSNVLGAAIFGATGGAVNAATKYKPFTAKSVTEAEYNEKCE
jgi:hypothetical protein